PALRRSGRRPRIPSLFSTISNNKPPPLPPQTGRAYKPARTSRQHPIRHPASIWIDGLSSDATSDLAEASYRPHVQEPSPGREPSSAAGKHPPRPFPGDYCQNQLYLAASPRLGAIVERHRVLGLGEEQPALGDEAEGRARDGETRGGHPDHAADR